MEESHWGASNDLPGSHLTIISTVISAKNMVKFNRLNDVKNVKAQ